MARLVARGHLTPDPIEVWGADIGNAYLEAKTKEKLYVVAGPEYEELEGHILYGLKSSGLRWSQKIHNIMLDMGFSPCKADPCVWLRNSKCATKYEYVAIYVDTFSLHVVALQSSFIPLKVSTTSNLREMDL